MYHCSAYIPTTTILSSLESCNNILSPHYIILDQIYLHLVFEKKNLFPTILVPFYYQCTHRILQLIFKATLDLFMTNQSDDSIKVLSVCESKAIWFGKLLSLMWKSVIHNWFDFLKFQICAAQKRATQPIKQQRERIWPFQTSNECLPNKERSQGHLKKL